jgi:hypothetical protein
VALVEVDVVGAQPSQKRVELLVDLGRREALEVSKNVIPASNAARVQASVCSRATPPE